MKSFSIVTGCHISEMRLEKRCQYGIFYFLFGIIYSWHKFILYVVTKMEGMFVRHNGGGVAGKAIRSCFLFVLFTMEYSWHKFIFIATKMEGMFVMNYRGGVGEKAVRSCFFIYLNYNEV